MTSHRLTIRKQGAVERELYATLDGALEALDARLELERPAARRGAIDMRLRRFEPEQLIAARLEVGGAGRFSLLPLGGVDLRGDGSTEVWVGGVRKRPLEAAPDGPPGAALRRALSGSG